MALINYFKLDGNQTDLITGKTLTVDGATWDYGKKGKQQKIISGTAQQLYSTSGFSFPETLTISQWVYAYSWTGMIFSFNSEQYSGPDVYFSGQILWNTGDGGNNPFKNGGTNVAYPSVNQWHLFTIVNDKISSQTKLYIDGVYAGTANYRSTYQNNRGFIIGNYSANTGYPFNGLIDDLKIFDYQLSDQEIANLYSETVVSDYGLIYTTDGRSCFTVRDDVVPFSGVKSISVDPPQQNLFPYQMRDTGWISNSGVYKLTYDNIGQITNAPIQQMDYQSSFTGLSYYVGKIGTPPFTSGTKIQFSCYQRGVGSQPKIKTLLWNTTQNKLLTYFNNTIPVTNQWKRYTQQYTVDTTGHNSGDNISLYIYGPYSQGMSDGSNFYQLMQLEQNEQQTQYTDIKRPYGIFKINNQIQDENNFVLNLYMKPEYNYTSKKEYIVNGLYNVQNGFIIGYNSGGDNKWFLWQHSISPSIATYSKFTYNMFDGNFHMITLVKVDQNAKLYVDGIKKVDVQFNPTNISKQIQLGYYMQATPTYNNPIQEYSNIYVGKAKDQAGNLIWTDEYIAKLYRSQNKFQGA